MRPILLVALIGAALPATAQTDTGGNVLSFEAGLGVQSAPTYFGSATTETGATGSFAFGRLSWGNLCLGCDESDGLSLTGSFRYIGERPAGEEEVPDGLTVEPRFTFGAVDAAVELGGGLSYTTPGFEGFAVVRRGFGGHEGYVAELGGDLVIAATDALTVKAGPRLLAGDDTFARTYFSTSGGPFEVGSFDAEGGVISRGAQVSARYQLNPDWAVTATARYDQLVGDAASSPISEDDDQTTFSLVVSRRFDIRF